MSNGEEIQLKKHLQLATSVAVTEKNSGSADGKEQHRRASRGGSDGEKLAAVTHVDSHGGRRVIRERREKSRL